MIHEDISDIDAIAPGLCGRIAYIKPTPAIEARRMGFCLPA